METRLLTDPEFHATYIEPVQNLSAVAVNHDDGGSGIDGGVLDIWPYVAAVPTADLAGEVVRQHVVDGVWRLGDGRWDHVLIATDTQNVHLVVVVDLVADKIFGHHLLDLNEKYGVARRPRSD